MWRYLVDCFVGDSCPWGLVFQVIRRFQVSSFELIYLLVWFVSVIHSGSLGVWMLQVFIFYLSYFIYLFIFFS